MGLFDRFAKVESPIIAMTLLSELGDEPAFVVQLRLISEREYVDASDRYTDARGKLDFKKYRPWWVRRIVVDWTGLTTNNMRRMIPVIQIDEEKAHAIFGNGQIPFSGEMAESLHLYAIDAFVTPITNRLNEEHQRLKEEMEERVRAARGNLPPGSDSPSA